MTQIYPNLGTRCPIRLAEMTFIAMHHTLGSREQGDANDEGFGSKILVLGLLPTGLYLVLYSPVPRVQIMI